jgi:hypothetical protein
MPKSRKQHPYFSLKAAKFLRDLIAEKYGDRVDEGEVPEEIMEVLGFYGLYHEVRKQSRFTHEETVEILRELHKQYGEEMSVSLLPKEAVEALVEYGYVEPIYQHPDYRRVTLLGITNGHA